MASVVRNDPLGGNVHQVPLHPLDEGYGQGQNPNQIVFPHPAIGNEQHHLSHCIGNGTPPVDLRAENDCAMWHGANNRTRGGGVEDLCTVGVIDFVKTGE